MQHFSDRQTEQDVGGAPPPCPRGSPQPRPAIQCAGSSLIAALALCAAALGVFAACETQAPYATCELDTEVTSKGICAGDGKGNTSCVVTQHPHCQDAICLSYYGQPPICSKVCTSDADCSNGTCWTFADGSALPGAVTGTEATQKTEKYCVSNATKAAADKASAATSNK